MRRGKVWAADRIVRRLTLEEYRELLIGVPSPSREQMEAFVRYVSSANSWYKELPTLPPGVLMSFYLDPGAGATRIFDRRGRVRQVDKKKGGFHPPYRWFATADYRARFGHAAFSLRIGPAADDEPSILGPGRAELVALPHEVLDAGTAAVSGLIHNRAACYQFWRSLPANYDDPSQVDWPAESGGAAAYAELLDRFQVLRAGAPVEEATLNDDKYLWGSPSGDLVLHRLLMPERERQQREIATALERIVDLVR
jgi:hypothetical protein